MRLFIVLATIFSVCCCFSVLNLFPVATTGQNFYQLDPAKKGLPNIALRDEEILLCQNFIDKNIQEINHRLTEKELQDILSQCSLLSNQKSKLLGSENDKVTTQSLLFENTRRKEPDFVTKEYTTVESSKKVNDKNAGQNERKSTENQTSKPEYQKTEIITAISHSSNTNWNLWKYLFGISDFINSTTESNIYFESSTDLESLTTENTGFWNIVLPGTKWCGSGDNAENDDDLGYFEDVDRCCRAHDKCDDLMMPGESKYNLTNTSQFTVLNCKCDDELYDCLSQIDSAASNAVGNTFFNIFERMCYTLDYPRICKKYRLFRCVEYVINETAEKVYQWRPAKKYLKTSFIIPGLVDSTS